MANYELGGRRFESFRARQAKKGPTDPFFMPGAREWIARMRHPDGRAKNLEVGDVDHHASRLEGKRKPLGDTANQRPFLVLPGAPARTWYSEVVGGSSQGPTAENSNSPLAHQGRALCRSNTLLANLLPVTGCDTVLFRTKSNNSGLYL